ncbi:aminotransferase class V-fold PLP-dependent enzyme [Planktomarina sp.]|nr:aminotransferase class V-fold PLP-dependent enzyme [Planktomarina sp.]MDA9099835.1 aminotransferase class V-fold PLP-dependent enzyme [Planktomarina sp.]
MQLDLDFIRGQFPAFEVPSLKEQSFFENAGGSYTCSQVQDRLKRFYLERKVQPYAPFEASRLGGAEMDEARSRLAAMLGVEDDELSFGPSTTQNTYVLSQAVAQWIKPNQTIIVTNQDHEANSGPWRRLAERGVTIKEWCINPVTGLLVLEDLRLLLDENVKMVCFPHCSNVVAAINPVEEITSMVRSVGAYSCVDGVSYAPHGFPNVDKLGADIYLFSAYKTYGPHQGLMVIRRELGMKLPNQGHYFNADSLYKRFTPAGPDHAQVAACAGMADYVDEVYQHHFTDKVAPAERCQMVHDLFRDYEVSLTQPILDYLTTKNSAELIGPTSAEGRAPTIAVKLQIPGEEAAKKMASFGVMAGGGDFYAVRPLKALSIEPEHGVLRLSFVHYTAPKDIDRLLSALDQVI